MLVEIGTVPAEEFRIVEHGGQRLRARREHLGLKVREVESAAAKLADLYRSEEFQLPISRISDIESKGTIPTVHRLYSLAAIYHLDILELLRWYELPVDSLRQDGAVSAARNSHISGVAPHGPLNVPLYLDPSFDHQRTCNFGRMVERWGVVPTEFLSQFAEELYTYGYVGTEDFTMYPMILPGSFVQIDESKNEVQEGGWRSEYERPIYFIETHDGFLCSWCSIKGSQLFIQPHPLSPVAPQILKHPQDGEVLGQVVGVAMRLTAPKGKEAAPVQRQFSVAQ
jgi:transcriptional regulator with XRE-family HTH domain